MLLGRRQVLEMAAVPLCLCQCVLRMADVHESWTTALTLAVC